MATYVAIVFNVSNSHVATHVVVNVASVEVSRLLKCLGNLSEHYIICKLNHEAGSRFPTQSMRV